jgi:O-antigen ligase
MWGAAIHVWTSHPIFGVGLSNWGVVAAETFRPGEIGGFYSLNPARLWGIEAHNTYVEVLAEQGVVGLAAFAWVFVDFWRRNTVLRSPTAQHRWAALGGRMQLGYVALGLEAGLIGWMAAAALYSTAGQHWMFTILGLNLLLHRLVTNGTGRARRRAAGPVGRRATQPGQVLVARTRS